MLRQNDVSIPKSVTVSGENEGQPFLLGYDVVRLAPSLPFDYPSDEESGFLTQLRHGDQHKLWCLSPELVLLRIFDILIEFMKHVHDSEPFSDVIRIHLTNFTLVSTASPHPPVPLAVVLRDLRVFFDINDEVERAHGGLMDHMTAGPGRKHFFDPKRWKRAAEMACRRFGFSTWILDVVRVKERLKRLLRSGEVADAHAQMELGWARLTHDQSSPFQGATTEDSERVRQLAKKNKEAWKYTVALWLWREHYGLTKSGKELELSGVAQILYVVPYCTNVAKLEGIPKRVVVNLGGENSPTTFAVSPTTFAVKQGAGSLAHDFQDYHEFQERTAAGRHLARPLVTFKPQHILLRIFELIMQYTRTVRPGNNMAEILSLNHLTALRRFSDAHVPLPVLLRDLRIFMECDAEVKDKLEGTSRPTRRGTERPISSLDSIKHDEQYKRERRWLDRDTWEKLAHDAKRLEAVGRWAADVRFDKARERLEAFLECPKVARAQAKLEQGWIGDDRSESHAGTSGPDPKPPVKRHNQSAMERRGVPRNPMNPVGEQDLEDGEIRPPIRCDSWELYRRRRGKQNPGMEADRQIKQGEQQEQIARRNLQMWKKALEWFNDFCDIVVGKEGAINWPAPGSVLPYSNLYSAGKHPTPTRAFVPQPRWQS
ncbi:hypothetical protein JCM3770_004768 [Rhodotorula araucariae]